MTCENNVEYQKNVLESRFIEFAFLCLDIKC